jgi:hypothetical protein
MIQPHTFHFNVTEHPTADWTLQQTPGSASWRREDCKFLLHDRHKIFSASLDEEVESWGIHVLRSPVRMPTANEYCERLIGSIRRECLDYVIPLHALHLCDDFFVSGFGITIRAVLIGPWARVFPNRCTTVRMLISAYEPCRASRVIAKPILAVCITSIDGKTLLHELRDRFIAEHTSCDRSHQDSCRVVCQLIDAARVKDQSPFT